MAQKPVYIYLKSQLSANDLVSSWAKKRGFSISLCDDLNIFRAAAATKQGTSWIGVWVGYSLEDQQDLHILESFITDLRRTPGLLYYCPRPNDYTYIGSTSLAGVNYFGWGDKTRARGRLLISKLSEMLFRSLAHWRKGNRFPARANAEKTIEMCPGEIRKPQIEEGRKIYLHSQIQTPENLLFWPGQWKPWTPPGKFKERDLVDRIELFFPHPKGIHVVLLNRCNLKCLMCPYHSPYYTRHHKSDFFKEAKSMSSDTMDKIIRYAGKNHIILQIGQIEEALLHPEIFEFIRRAKESGVPHIHLTTNGTLLHSEKCQELVDSGVDSVMFSLDAATPETYQKIRGGDLEKIEENIKRFIPLARKGRIRVTVSLVLQPEAENERDLFIKKWKQLGVDHVTFYVLTESDPKTGEMIRKKELYDKGNRYPCASPWIQAVVYPEGEVSLCCKSLTDVGWRGIVSVGNLKEDSFEDIWRGDLFSSVRRELLRGRFREFTICENCPIWSAAHTITEEYGDRVRVYNETMETITFRR